MDNEETITFLDWKTEEPKEYLLNYPNTISITRKLNVHCPLDKTQLLSTPTNDGWNTQYYIYCPNCGEDYSNLPSLRQSEVDIFFQSKIESYKKELVEIRERSKDLSLRIQKAEQNLLEQNLPKCTVENCHGSCAGITCEKTC